MAALFSYLRRNIMKYVIFQRMNMYVPVIVPEHCTHADIKIEGHRPISAGFFSVEFVRRKSVINGRTILEAEVNVSEQCAESLKLGPLPQDRELLIELLINSGTYAFLDF